MGTSIYYDARRSTGLTPSERAGVDEVVRRYAVEDRIEEFNRTGQGTDWQSFCVYDGSDPSHTDTVFEGATGLPTNDLDAAWEGVRHWCAALTEIRRILPDAVWSVHVEHHPIPWDEGRQEYDPSG